MTKEEQADPKDEVKANKNKRRVKSYVAFGSIALGPLVGVIAGQTAESGAIGFTVTIAWIGAMIAIGFYLLGPDAKKLFEDW